jgi:hypothetical protein
MKRKNKKVKKIKKEAEMNRLPKNRSFLLLLVFCFFHNGFSDLANPTDNIRRLCSFPGGLRPIVEVWMT